MAISKVILNGEVQMDVTSDTVTAGSMLSGTTATKNDGTKATGTIASKSSSDLTASGATVTAPAGYYSANASKSVTTMTLPTTTSTSATSGYTSKATLDRSTSDRYLNIAPGYNSAGGYYKISKVANGSVTAPSSISGTSATVSTGTNTLTLTKSVSVTPNVTTAGYISSGTAGSCSVSLTASVTTKAAATITPSTSAQSIAAGTYLTGKQTISAMPSGTAGTPTASKGSVSNHAISVTPSVTNTTGYITGGTKTGTAVNVSASELVSGTKSITENGTDIDVTNYACVDVNVPTGPRCTVTITQAGSVTSGRMYFTYNDVQYYDLGDTLIPKNGIIKLYSYYGDNNYLYINGVQVIGGYGSLTNYEYTVTSDIEINFTKNNYNGYIYITTFPKPSTVSGTFSFDSGGEKSITIPYTGNGYPVAVLIYVTGGILEPDNTNWYTVIKDKAVGSFMFIKDRMNIAPSYSGDASTDVGRGMVISKNSTTSATSFYATNYENSYLEFFSNYTSSSYQNRVAVMPNANTLKILVHYSGYSFQRNVDYTYHIIYSE